MSSKKKTFSKRKWLNPKGSHSSGSVFAYSGPAPWNPKVHTNLLEIADCHCKARLHQSDVDTPADFLKKLKKLQAVIAEYVEFLEK